MQGARNVHSIPWGISTRFTVLLSLGDFLLPVALAYLVGIDVVFAEDCIVTAGWFEIAGQLS